MDRKRRRKRGMMIHAHYKMKEEIERKGDLQKRGNKERGNEKRIRNKR